MSYRLEPGRGHERVRAAEAVADGEGRFSDVRGRIARGGDVRLRLLGDPSDWVRHQVTLRTVHDGAGPLLANVERAVSGD